MDKIYCSLDIETSGFDPDKCEVLEVGFVKFTVQKNKVKILEEWSQAFKPARPVPAHIHGLTGITQKELEEAPRFSEYREFLQGKLGKDVIVGHNVAFDIKFLESAGIKFSGQSIDTLDLVQFLLPTHHSYNLENLMHKFGISHKKAHRALADSRACFYLLGKLIGIYQSFSRQMQTQIKELISGHDLAWEPLLEAKFSKVRSSRRKRIFAKPALFRRKKKKLELVPQVIYNYPLQADYVEELAESLGQSKEKILLVLPKHQQVIKFWEQGLAEAIFSAEHLFSEEKFKKFLNKKNHSADEIKFLLKILVWKNTNWQSKTLLDLNLSFFGGQFRESVSGGLAEDPAKSLLAATDYQTFLQLSKKRQCIKRFVVFCGLQEFEEQAGLNIGVKATWGKINYLLKSIYNPEINIGLPRYRAAVEQALLATDLFFGLVSALLYKHLPVQFVEVTEQYEYAENYQKIFKAAKNYLAKMEIINRDLRSAEIKKICGSLEKFFRSDKSQVRWIELGEHRCGFYSSPLDIAGKVKKILLPFKKIAFADSLGHEKVLKYFVSRLGLEDYRQIALKQKKSGKLKRNTVKCHIVLKAVSEQQLIPLLQNDSLPAAVLFGGGPQVREFYDRYYFELKPHASLFSQVSSGGSNKIFRNFSINNNGLLLATNKFILKALRNRGNVSPTGRLKIKTLVVCQLPFEQNAHPYTEAVSRQFPDPFGDFYLPKALYNFHSILQFFSTNELKYLYIFDPRLAQPYGQDFLSYLKNLNNFKLI
ncbi:MAG: exonuclease domain-containing protein [Patescibacteria group bacterium]|nr:exonuclease domain-containing protein [Patescibacteria group bacterium]